MYLKVPLVLGFALLLTLPSVHAKDKEKKHHGKGKDQEGRDHSRENDRDNSSRQVVIVHQTDRRGILLGQRPIVRVEERRDEGRDVRYSRPDYRHFDYSDSHRDVSYRSRYPQQVVVYEQRPYHYNYYDLQVVLQREGYYDGPIDGIWGPGSRSSLRRYQVAQGWRDDDQVDGRLIVNFNLGY